MVAGAINARSRSPSACADVRTRLSFLKLLRAVASKRRTETLASVEISCFFFFVFVCLFVFFFAYVLNRCNRK